MEYQKASKVERKLQIKLTKKIPKEKYASPEERPILLIILISI